MNLIFDTHAHYDDEAFDADREALLASMPENGVGLIVDPGCDLDTSRRAVEIAEQYPHVYAAVGWHPENCAPYTRESLDTLRAWAKNPKVVAIGEIGLDYHYEDVPRTQQRVAFEKQLSLAEELDLPVIVHDRDVIRTADFLIDMGPGGGEAGGRIVASGTPEEIQLNPDSITGQYV